MARIEGFRIRNFRTLKDITLGRLWDTPKGKPLTPMTAVIGKNGAGKSTLFDAFGFLADCLKVGVEEACDLRGGFQKIRSQGQDGPIDFEVCFQEGTNDRSTITYHLLIELDESGRPFVLNELLRQQQNIFLFLRDGKGAVWRGETEGVNQEGFNLFKFMQEVASQENNSEEVELVELEDKRKLGIATLGALKQHPRISAFRRFIEGWHLSYFTPDAARSLPLAGPQKHLNVHGDNLGNVVQYMQREYPERFKHIIERIAGKIPGIHQIDTVTTPDGRLLLRFNDKGFQDPFYAQQMSDGTLKVFAYLLLLEDPTPPPFLCIEEPENGLHHKLLELLAEEFRDHAYQEGGSQVFITTHQPYLVDALKPDEVWVLEKGEDGFSRVLRADSIPAVVNMVEQGLPLGGLWYSDYLDPR